MSFKRKEKLVIGSKKKIAEGSPSGEKRGGKSTLINTLCLRGKGLEL